MNKTLTTFITILLFVSSYTINAHELNITLKDPFIEQLKSQLGRRNIIYNDIVKNNPILINNSLSSKHVSHIPCLIEVIVPIENHDYVTRRYFPELCSQLTLQIKSPPSESKFSKDSGLPKPHSPEGSLEFIEMLKRAKDQKSKSLNGDSKPNK